MTPRHTQTLNTCPPRKPFARPSRLTAALALALAGGSALAVDFSYSGFGNLTAGRVVGDNGPFRVYLPNGNSVDPDYPIAQTWSKCPCAIVDFVHAGIYEKRLSLDTESRVGLQGTLNFNSDFSLTAQGVARGVAKKAKLDLEWLYLSYNLNSQWTVQAGRKRLPLLNYSDFQDVSFAFPWVRVPFDVYGWEVTNYNGANITFRDDFKGWAIKSNAYVGSENFKKNPMGKIEGTDQMNVNWKGMRGIDLEINRDWFTARFAINKSKQHSEMVAADGTVTQRVPGDAATFGSHADQTFKSLSISVDYQDFIGRFELQKISRAPADRSFDGTLISLGYRLGKFTPTVFTTALKHKPPGSSGVVQKDSILGATLRYNLSDTSSLKAQWDRIMWDNYPSPGASYYKLRRNVMTVSYDFIF